MDTSYLHAVKLNTDADSSSSLILSHIKRGEDDVDVSQYSQLSKNEKSIVVRIYESLGGVGKGELVIDEKYFKVDKVLKTNGLENQVFEELEVKKGVVGINLKGFEIGTFKILLK